MNLEVFPKRAAVSDDAMARIDKDNETRGTKEGQWILCVNVKEESATDKPDGSDSVASFEVYDTEARMLLPEKSSFLLEVLPVWFPMAHRQVCSTTYW